MEKIYISEGNIKLTSTNNAKFLIWSLPSKVTCPNSTPLCRENCYASKSEVRFKKNVLGSRERNLRISKTPEFVDRMIIEIQGYLDKKSYKDKEVFFRIHESGDFYSESYLINIFRIANHFRTNPNIKFLAYTKSFDILKDWIEVLPSNMIIRGSVWSDTNDKDLQLIHEMKLPIFTAYPKNEIPDNYIKCIGDCGACKACYITTNDIAVAIH